MSGTKPFQIGFALVFALVHLGAAGSLAQTPATSSWTGKAVVPRTRSFTIKENNQAPLRPGLPAIYHVTREVGRLLLIETDGLSGWVSSDQVVPLEQADSFFTSQIRANPRDSFAYAMRAIAVLAAKPDFKTAMADFDEAVRLNPATPSLAAAAEWPGWPSKRLSKPWPISTKRFGLIRATPLT